MRSEKKKNGIEDYDLPGEASWAPLRHIEKQQGGQVKQGMPQCHASPKVAVHPAWKIIHGKTHIKRKILPKK